MILKTIKDILEDKYLLLFTINSLIENNKNLSSFKIYCMNTLIEDNEKSKTSKMYSINPFKASLGIITKIPQTKLPSNTYISGILSKISIDTNIFVSYGLIW